MSYADLIFAICMFSIAGLGCVSILIVVFVDLHFQKKLIKIKEGEKWPN